MCLQPNPNGLQDSAPPRPGLQGSARIGKEPRLASFPRKELRPCLCDQITLGVPTPTHKGLGLYTEPLSSALKTQRPLQAEVGSGPDPSLAG